MGRDKNKQDRGAMGKDQATCLLYYGIQMV